MSIEHQHALPEIKRQFNPSSYTRAADKWLKDNAAFCVPSDGYVMVFQNRGFAWSRDPRPSDYRTGCVAVPVRYGLDFLVAVDSIRDVNFMTDEAAVAWEILL